MDPAWEREKEITSATRRDVVCPALPASGLQHVGFVEAAYSEAFHGTLQVFADFK